jgi:hypothetical protein
MILKFSKRKNQKAKGFVYFCSKNNNSLINMVLLRLKNNLKGEHVVVFDKTVSEFNFEKFFDSGYYVDNIVDIFESFKKFLKVCEQTQITYFFNNVFKIPKEISLEPKKTLEVDGYFNFDNLKISSRKKLLQYYLPIKNSYIKLKILKKVSDGRKKIIDKISDISNFQSLILIFKKITTNPQSEFIKYNQDDLESFQKKNQKYFKEIEIMKNELKPHLEFFDKSLINKYGIKMLENKDYNKINDKIKEWLDSCNKCGKGEIIKNNENFTNSTSCPCESKNFSIDNLCKSFQNF